MNKEQLTDFLLENLEKEILRRKNHDTWVEWIPTHLNNRYLELILEFPEDFAIPFSTFTEPPQNTAKAEGK